jgi:hypothetical protein
MDQVKVYAGVAKKHHFWILFAIVVIVALVVWLKASSSLEAKYTSNKQTITGAQDSVQKVTSSEQFNPRFTAKVENLHEGLKNQVFDAWQKLYERQNAMFEWPDLSEFDVNVDLKKLGSDEEIPNYIRVIYNENVVRQQWQALFAEGEEGINLRRQKAPTDRVADSDEGDEGPRGVEYEGLVVWKPALRDEIISRYYSPVSTPSTTRIRLGQEDFWLFQALVEVVHTVNLGATDSLKAPIKEILALDVAQWAIAASLESEAAIWTPGSKSSGNSMNSMMSSGAGGPNSAAMQGANAPAAPTGQNGGAAAATGGGTTSGPSESDNEWLADRYLDDKGQPLADVKNQPFAEFKQVFVYMRFIMDQRNIPNLVAACANARLPIETRQIRVQVLKTDGLDSSGSSLFSGGGVGGGMGPGGMTSGGMGPGGMTSGGMTSGGMGPGGMGPGGMTSGGMTSGGMTSGGMGPGGMGPGGMGPGGVGGGLGSGAQDGGVETTDYDAIVSLSGVIYLYNKPDIAKLGTGTAGAPEKRSFGVPTKSVHPPGSSGGGSSFGPAMSGPSTSGS